jgi:signal transduction histidine kinase
MKPSTKKRLFNFLFLLGVFFFLGLFFSSEAYFLKVFLKEKAVFRLHLLIYLTRWLPWAFLAPLVIALGRRFSLRQDKRVLHFFIHFAASFIITPLHTLFVFLLIRLTALIPTSTELWEGSRYPLDFGPLFKTLFSNHFHFNLLTYWIILGAFYGIDYYKRYRERELHTCQLEAQLAKAHLQTLKIQVHPHFLFNTLHTISSLVYRNPSAADRMISRLSELLRSTLEQAESQETSLKDEMETLDQYVEIMKTRFGDRLKVEYDVQPEALGAFVPNFILQPLVENAIRHGINPRKEGGVVRIIACLEDARLLMRITDNGLGLKEKEDVLIKKGFGLKNTKERLQKLYGQDVLFELKNREGGGAELTLGVPYHTQPVGCEIPAERS